MEHAGVAAMEVAARRSAIGHEERVAQKNRVGDAIAQMVDRVPRRRPNLDRLFAKPQAVSFI